MFNQGCVPKGPVTQGGRMGNARPAHWKFAIWASALSFARRASSFVTRSSSALDQRWTSAMHASSFAVCVGIFWACSKTCAELDAWIYTPKARQTCVERARPAPDMRGAHALYTHSALATRRAFCVSSLAFPKLWQKLGTRSFPISNALAVRRRTRCMRGPFVQRASNTLCIRGSCYHVRSVCALCAPVCALCAPCMRPAR